MDTLPDSVLEYLQGKVCDRLMPACLCVSASGQLLDWTGTVEAYALGALECGLPAQELLPMLVGLENIDQPLIFPLVNLAQGVTANLHILPRSEGGLHVLLLDASEEHDRQQAWQQKVHEVQLLNARLHKVLRQLNKTQAELEQKRLETEEASRLKSQFISSMSHEFRTPLTSIIGYAEMLQRGLLSEQQLGDASQAIASGAQHLMSLIDNVLDQACFAVGGGNLDIQAVDLSQLMTDIQTLFAPMAAKKQLQFSCNSRLPEHCWVKTDGLRLRQLLVNLCSNAIKYTETGSVSLSYSYTDGQFHCIVKDTGVGIAPEQQEAIFSAFHRVPEQSNQVGAGLGLAITREILELMGGGLSLNSKPGAGSEFLLSLPVEAVRMPAEQDAEPAAAQEQRELTLLVAEDNPDSAQLLELFLVEAGHKVLLAGTGQEAIDILARQAVDIVLMDMHMPVMNGDEAVQILRARGFTRPILALSASTLGQDRQRALDAGCDNYLLKPIAMDELLSKVDEVAFSVR